VLADQHPRRPDTKPSESITDSRKFVDALEPYDEEFPFYEQWGEKLLTSSRPVSPIGWSKLPTLSQSLTRFSNTSFPIPITTLHRNDFVLLWTLLSTTRPYISSSKVKYSFYTYFICVMQLLLDGYRSWLFIDSLW